MAEKQVTAEAVETNEVVEKAKDFWSKFSRPIIIAGSAFILVVGGWYGYQKLVKEPNELKAADLIYPAEQLFGKMAQQGEFNKDSVGRVLNGGEGVSTGVLKIISSYSGTAAGNRARYIAGACYLHSGDFANAIKYLKDFSTKATQVQAAAYGMLGDAYAEQKKNTEALDYYRKAATVNSTDEFTAPEALYKAARFAEATGSKDEAIKLFKELKEGFPSNRHIAEADKYLARLGVLD